jgi:hypothetical protein
LARAGGGGSVWDIFYWTVECRYRYSRKTKGTTYAIGVESAFQRLSR